MFYFGRRLAYVACACCFAMGLLGVGLFTSVPATTLTFLLTGWFVVREVRAVPETGTLNISQKTGTLNVSGQAAGALAIPGEIRPLAVSRERPGRPEMLSVPVSWVIVAGGFHDLGAMDRANAALAGVPDRAWRPRPPRRARDRATGSAADPRVVCHKVPRPKSAAPLAESMLSRKGLTVAAEVTPPNPPRASSSTAATVPGRTSTGCTPSTPCWHVHDEGAPAWLKVKHRAVKAIARRQERAALRIARTVVANSRPRAGPSSRPGCGCVESPRRVPRDGSVLGAARQSSAPQPGRRLRIPDGDRVVAFVGALGFDLNKGFDVVWTRVGTAGGCAAISRHAPGRRRWRTASVLAPRSRTGRHRAIACGSSATPPACAKCWPPPICSSARSATRRTG